MGRGGDVESIQLWHEKAGARARSRLHSRLLTRAAAASIEHGDRSLAANDIDAVSACIMEHIVGISARRKLAQEIAVLSVECSN